VRPPKGTSAVFWWRETARWVIGWLARRCKVSPFHLPLLKVSPFHRPIVQGCSVERAENFSKSFNSSYHRTWHRYLYVHTAQSMGNWKAKPSTQSHFKSQTSWFKTLEPLSTQWHRHNPLTVHTQDIYIYIIYVRTVGIQGGVEVSDIVPPR
jgi:hypothetical protein